MKKIPGFLLFLIFTVASSLLAIKIELLQYDEKYIVGNPGWTFRGCFGVALGVVALLFYYFHCRRTATKEQLK